MSCCTCTCIHWFALVSHHYYEYIQHPDVRRDEREKIGKMFGFAKTQGWIGNEKSDSDTSSGDDSDGSI